MEEKQKTVRTRARSALARTGPFPGMADPESLFRQLFLEAVDAAFVLDPETMRFVLVNPRFAEITGFAEEELLAESFQPASVIYGRSREKAERELGETKPGESSISEWILSGKGGEVRDVEVAIRGLVLANRRHLLCHLRDIGPRKDLERRLKRQADTQRLKAIEAAKAGMSVYHLADRIGRVSDFLHRLAAAADEPALFEELKEGLVGPDGLGYSQAALFLVEGKQLSCEFASREAPIKRFHLDKNHKLARIGRSQEIYSDAATGEIVLPLEVGGELLGLLQIYFDEEDRLLFDEHETARHGQESLLATIGIAFSTLLASMRLSRESREQARIDPLTGLLNRKHFHARLIEEAKRALRYRRELSLLLVGIDGFRETNESWGHVTGDRVLVHLARVLSKEFREIDILCRYGSDEFGLLLPETGLEEAKRKAEHLRTRVERAPFVPADDPGGKIELSISVGVAARREGQADPDEITKHCEEALYTAKREGKNLVCSFEGRTKPLPRRLSTKLE